jgi:lysophospholipase L1-like esterase/dienelactone hydrolase
MFQGQGCPELSTMKILHALLVFVILSSGFALGRDPIPQTQLWDMENLGKTPAHEWGKKEGDIREVYFTGEPYKGHPTRVFAYVGIPEGKGPFPGVVLVHGGGGQAFDKWVAHWNANGYAAIAMDTAGNGPGKERLADGGPDQSHDYKFPAFSECTIKDVWTYHAVADVVLAHSLLLSLPEVDKDRTALTGISWGGYLTCLVSGIDQRFKASVPVYGCGFLDDNSVWLKNFAAYDEASRRLWVRNFDPGQHIHRVTFPMLFLNGTNDFAYPLDSHRKTVEQVKPGLATVSIHHRLKHGHIWTFTEVDRFIGSVLAGGEKLVRLGNLKVRDGKAIASLEGFESAASVKLWYTGDTGAWQQRNWQASDGELSGGSALATIPDVRPITFYLEVTDKGGLKTTTTFAELFQDIKDPHRAVLPEPKLENDFYDWHARHAGILRLKKEVAPEIVLVGDSITHMWGGLPTEPNRQNGKESWGRLFGNRALNLGFGWDRTQNAIWRIDHGELDGISPKVVVVHIGTNNLAGTKNHQAGTPEEIAQGIGAVVGRLRKKLPGAKIILMAVFPRGEMAGNPMRAKIQAINSGLPAVAGQFGATLIDISGALLDGNGNFPREMARDFLHPTEKGYQVWADALVEKGGMAWQK